jgi:hypothetical protein
MADPRIELAGLVAGASADAVLGALDGTRILLRVGQGRVCDQSDAAGLLNLVNLGARLFPHWEFAVADGIHVDGGFFGAGNLLELLSAVARRVRPEPTRDPGEQFELCWGASPEGPGLAVDAAGWSCSVGPEHLRLEPTDGPAVGALAAGCWAVGQLLVRVLGPHGMAGHLTDGFRWNLLDYQAHEAPLTATVAKPWRLPALTAAGCGSVGSSLLYTGLLVGAMGGPVDLADPDPFSHRNRLRYPILLEDLVGTMKVKWLSELCREAGIEAHAHEQDIKAYTNGFDRPPSVDLVVVSTDTLAGRRDATDLLAAATVNLGIAGLQLHASRHAFGPDGCAYCQYVNMAPPLSGAEVIAGLVGLTAERVVAIEFGDGRLTDGDAAAIALSGKFGDDPPPAGTRLADLRRRAYAQASIPAGDGDLRVSSPHVSAMAGLLGLVESLKHGDPILEPFRLAGRVNLDLSGEPAGFVAAAPRDPSGRCLCHRGFRRVAWHELREHGAREDDDFGGQGT